MARAADFTTYINAVEDASLDRKFDRLATTGARAFGTIAQAANAANAASAGLLRGSGTGGLGGGVTRQLTDQAAAARNVARANQEVSRVAPLVASGLRSEAAAAGEASRQHQALARSLSATSTALNVVQGPLGPVAGRVGAAARALATLTGVQLGTATFGALAFSVARLGNNFAVLEGKLRPYFQSQRQVNSAMADIENIATRSRAALEPVADLYTKLTQNADRYGFSQARIARITRLASQSATLSGGTEQSRAAGLYQFSQGIAANRLGGDELRSLLENLPQLASAIADGMGVTIGQLRTLGSEGALTAQQVTAALERSAETIERRFAALPLTLSTAATLFKNNLTLVVGQFDRMIGLSAGLTSLLSAVGGNLREILSLALGVGAAFALIKIGRRVGGFVSELGTAQLQTIQLERAFMGVQVAVGGLAQAEASAASARAVHAAAALAQSRSRVLGIEANIAQIAAERNALRGGVLASGTAGGFSRAAYRAALAEETRLSQQLAIATTELKIAKDAETGAKIANTAATRANSAAQAGLATASNTGVTAATRLTIAQLALTRATQAHGVGSVQYVTALGRVNAAKRAAATGGGLLAGALRLVGGATGVVGIGLTALTTGLIYYASRQTEATETTDRARQTMEDYAAIVDSTTGKVRALADAEERRVRRQAQSSIAAFEQGEGATLRSRAANLLRQRGRFSPTPSGFPTPQAVGAGPNNDAFGNPYSPIQGQRNYSEDYRNRLRNSQWGAQFRQAEDFERIARMMESGSRGYTQAIDEVNRRANAGERAFIDFRSAVRGTTEQLGALREEERTGQRTLRVLEGGTDPAFTERQAQADAELAAGVARQSREMQRRIARENTTDDNALYNRNLSENKDSAYRSFGVPSPEDIEQIRERLRTLQRQPIAAGQERMRADAVAGLNAELETAVRRNAQYRTTVEGAARALTQAQTAERDRNREITQGNRETRDAIEVAKARAATILNAGLLQLERSRPQLGDREYQAQRIALLQTYDQEIDALDQRAGASQRGTTALIADARRVAQEFERLDNRRTEVLGRYTDEPRPAVRAERDISELTEAQQRLGEGLYPRATLERDIANIRDGLQRPFREILRDHERQRQVQLLLIQGRQLEAEALRQVQALTAQGATVSEQQYQQLVRNAEENERINDILSRRERIVGLLQGSVDATRNSLEQFFMDVRTDGPAAAGDLARNMLRNFQQIEVRQFVERITAGADGKVRALISGRSAVEQASFAFAGQLDTSSREIVTLADASRTTAATMIAAANDIRRGVAESLASPTPAAIAGNLPNPIVRATEAAVSSVLRIGNPLRQMVVGGDSHARHVARGSHGVDLRAQTGTSVYAPFEGTLSTSRSERGGLQAFITSLDGRVRAGFSHLSGINRDMLGAIVQAGRAFASTGSSGGVAPHLHSSLRIDGQARDPMRFFGRSLVLPGSARASASRSIQRPGSLDDIAALLAQLPPEQGGGSADDVAAASLAAMRRRNTQAAAAALGAYETIGFGQADRREAREARTPSPADTYNAIGESIGDRLDTALGTKFFKGVGAQLGTALQGASYGQMSSGIARSLGLKQSNTGAQIGGAAGSALAASVGLPPELGGFIGGLIGGTIGGLFKKTKTGGATISMGDFGGYTVSSSTGNDRQLRNATKSAAGNVIAGVEDIARSLFGTVGDFGALSIGVRKDKFVLDPTGRGKTKGGSTERFDSEQEAIARAIELAISRGAIEGISAASQKILQSGQDLQRALEKALIIESIPRRLLQRTNPVRFAVEELNREFQYMIQILKEAGATGEQFADAQMLYELERAEAVKQAAASVFGQIEDYLQEMLSGQSSPFNRQTVYENAQAELNKFVGDITAGKVVDQTDLLAAAKNYQDALGGLFGRGSEFFSGFDWLFNLLSQAKGNAEGMIAGATGLPPSPFEGDAAVQDAINRTTGAIDNQTNVLGGLLLELIEQAAGGGGGGGDSSIAYLAGFGGGSGLQSRLNNLPD